jgi:hypothetical protein
LILASIIKDLVDGKIQQARFRVLLSHCDNAHGAASRLWFNLNPGGQQNLAAGFARASRNCCGHAGAFG